MGRESAANFYRQNVLIVTEKSLISFTLIRLIYLLNWGTLG